jgi:hypothetical protein
MQLSLWEQQWINWSTRQQGLRRYWNVRSLGLVIFSSCWNRTTTLSTKVENMNDSILSFFKIIKNQLFEQTYLQEQILKVYVTLQMKIFFFWKILMEISRLPTACITVRKKRTSLDLLLSVEGQSYKQPSKIIINDLFCHKVATAEQDHSLCLSVLP